MSADPGKTAHDLDKWATSLQQRAQRFTDLHERMESLRITETSADGAVRVTVDGNGLPTELTITDEGAGVEPERLSAQLMASLRAAQARLRSQVESLTGEVVGEDEAGTMIVGQYAQRFPEETSAEDGEPDAVEGRRIAELSEDED